MAGIPDYSTTAVSNTAVGGINIQEGWAPANANNAIRALMADIATMTQGGAKIAEVTVASATTCNILGALSDFIAISGTTTITSLGTGTNRRKFVRFTGALTLTHDSTSLILPGAANITTAAGDTMIVESDASNNVRVLAYQRADGSSINVMGGDSGSGGKRGLVPAPASGDAAANKYLKADGTWAAIASGAGVAVGTVVDYAGTSAPSKWLFCYGQNVSRTTYSDLFTALSTTYGTGDGSTTFGLPDLRGRVVAGKDDMGGTSANRLTGLSGGLNGDNLGASGGEEAHTLTTTEMPAHTHDAKGASGAGSGSHFATSSGSSSTVTSESTGTGGAHNTVQPTFILNKIIYAGV